MKIKKRWIVLIVIACTLAVIAVAITCTIFALRAKQRAEGRDRVEKYMSELSEYLPQTDMTNISIDIGMYAYSGESALDTDFYAVYERIAYADSPMSIGFDLSVEDDNPSMSISLNGQEQRVGSVYLYNGRLYVCPYDDDYLVESERIAAIYDAQELLGDADWPHIGAEDWQNMQTELNLDGLLELLGLQSEEDMNVLSSLADDPEKLFTDARKAEKYYYPHYVFDMDVGCFESYFEQLELQISEQYDAKFKGRSACMYVSLQETDLRFTMEFSDIISVGINSSSIVTAFDILLDPDADKAYVSDDVYECDRFLRGSVASDTDRSDESLTTIESGTVKNSYLLDLWTDHSCKYRIIGDGIMAIFYEGRADIVCLDGRRARTLEYEYNIVGIYGDGEYATVVLGEPISDYRYDYLFSENIIPGGNKYKCITYNLSDFSVVSEVIVETDCGQQVKVACLCGDTFVLGGDGWCYFIDILGGDYVLNTDFYALRGVWHYDGASDRIWLYDYYLCAVIVDLKDYSYTFTDAMPEEEDYLPYRAEAEGYEYVDCIAPWQGYELAFARADGNDYLVIYDGQVGGVVASVRVDYTVQYSFFVTDDDKLVWWGNGVLYVVDLNALLSQG